MEIFYDISTLGIGFVNSSRRTGVYRVAEAVALELANMQECNVHFCSCYNVNALHQSIAYQQSVPAFHHIPFPTIKNAYFRQKEYQLRARLLREALQSRTIAAPGERLTAFVKMQAARVAQKFFFSGNKKFLPLAQFSGADVYHTPFFAIPPSIRQAGFKSLFATCYDLIPVFKPEYCNTESIRLTHDFLNSLTPETWIPCISDFTRTELLTYMGNRIDPQKAVVTELAASAIFYKSTDLLLNRTACLQYGIPDAPFILSVCTLEPRKNIDLVIKAFIQLVQQQHLSQLSLVLVGNKGLKSAELINAIDCSAAIKKRIIVTGYVADEHLAAIYSEALLFVYPSFYEGFGLPPLEAMQCGVPVITSNTSSLPEVVGDAGLMVNPTDLDSLCQAMLSIYRNPALREQLSQKSLERARLFSWRRCAEKTVAAYKTSLLA